MKKLLLATTVLATLTAPAAAMPPVSQAVVRLPLEIFIPVVILLIVIFLWRISRRSQ